MIWAIWKLGWKEAKPRVMAMCLGGGLFLVPYLALYVIPYFHGNHRHHPEHRRPWRIGLSVERHLDLYRIGQENFTVQR